MLLRMGIAIAIGRGKGRNAIHQYLNITKFSIWCTALYLDVSAWPFINNRNMKSLLNILRLNAINNFVNLI